MSEERGRYVVKLGWSYLVSVVNVGDAGDRRWTITEDQADATRFRGPEAEALARELVGTRVVRLVSRISLPTLRLLPPSTFGDALRMLREAHDRSLGDVARAIGVSVVVVSEIERNKKPASDAEKRALVEAAMFAPIERAAPPVSFDDEDPSPTRCGTFGASG